MGERDREPDLAGAQGVVFGDNAVQVNIFSRQRQVPRSDYSAQVHRMAPEVLLDREEELAELADFCTRPGPGGYLLWSAEAWAGKSALLASFVREPPLATRVVSFFVTARLAAQNDREAFLDVVIEQLAELLNETVPEVSTPATRPSHFMRMLDAAAAACVRDGRRLVLVVDGLDEDTGAGEHSIAALLPPSPIAGMRIVVAARPDPPLPDDVPEDHPLRQPAVMRGLTPSPHARVISVEAKRDLNRLLAGTPIEQDLLGLVVASGGGLSGRDLEELTGHQPWRVDECLKAVTGRAFTRRTGGWSEEQAAQEVYLLAHEDLQQMVVASLGNQRLDEYRQRLRAWAEGYQSRHWPAQTPEYLLRGYFRQAQADADLPAMVGCALDPARQERMLDLSGGDAAALTEVVNTQAAMIDGGSPDLRTMILLGIRHADLVRRNTEMPAALPALWARLERHSRAETLIRSIPEHATQLSAWGELLCVLAGQGDEVRARAVLDDAIPQAIAAAGSKANQVLERLVERLIALGHLAYADELAARIAGDETALGAAAAVARAWAAAGDVDRARAAAENVQRAAGQMLDGDDGKLPRKPELRDLVVAPVLVKLAQMWGELGDVDRARQAVARLQQFVLRRATAGTEKKLDDARPYDDAKLLRALGQAWIGAGDGRPAQAAVNDIVDIAGGLTHSSDLGYAVWALHEALRLSVAADDHARAAGLAQVLIKQDQRRLPSDTTPASGYAIAEVVDSWAAAGRITEAEELARAITDPDADEQCLARIRALTGVIRACVRSGDHGRAQPVAHEIDDLAVTVAWPRDKVNALTQAAHAWVEVGDLDRAETRAEDAHEQARNVPHTPKMTFNIAADATAATVAAVQESARKLAVFRDIPLDATQLVLRVAAPAAALTADVARAMELARTVEHRASRTWALAAARRMAAAATWSTGGADPFESIVRSITEFDTTAWLVEESSWGATQSKEAAAAEDFVKVVVGLTLDVWDLVAEADDAVAAGDAARSRAVARDAEQLARYVSPFDFRTQRDVLEADLWRHSTPGDQDRANAFIRCVIRPDDRMWALSAAVRALVISGVFNLIERRALITAAHLLKAWAAATAARAWAVSGAPDRARGTVAGIEKFARSITVPTSRTVVAAVVAKAWRDVGDLPHARTAAEWVEEQARSFEDEVEQSWARSDASLAWAWAGEARHAAALLEEVEEPRRQAAVLLRLAEQLDGPPSDAVIAQALRLGPAGWQQALHGLVVRRPAEVVAAADQILADRAQRRSR